MPDLAEFMGQEPTFTAIVNGHYGTGKTHFGLTFPKVYAVCVADRGIDILRRKGNEKLRQNLVWYEYVNPVDDKEMLEFFKEPGGGLERILTHVKQLAHEGKIKTLLMDGFTYLVDIKWRQINLTEVEKSSRTGNMDAQAMYRNLGLYLMRFVTRDLLPLSTRHGLNIVLTCHLKRESEQTLEGNKERAGKVDKMSDIAPLIEGGFRSKAEGLFGASLYLDAKLIGGKAVYTAYCQKTTAMRTVVNAKNRYGLPAVVENVSYDKLVSCMDTGIKATGHVVGQTGGKV